MEITGSSSDFIADAALPAVMKRFIQRQLRRWPGLFLYAEPFAISDLTDWRLPDPDDDGFPNVITFSAGQEMEGFWEEHGYALNSSGEGPFSIFYHLRAQPLRARRVTQVECADSEDTQAAEGIGLLLSTYFTVSLVTPEDPARDPFSGSVLNDFLLSYEEAVGERRT
ncbi:hypothetical protein [Streptomyces sp. NPDC088725]|uniref:hypothetical protein n=1 Tax=Streptomyces sp. NPDC088725 TaxID=3365873 RepID=UPI00381DE82F